MWKRSAGVAVVLALAPIISPFVFCLRDRPAGPRIVRWWFGLAARRLGLELVIHGRPPPQPALWCANHVSWLDVVALGACRGLVFVSKAEVRRWPLLGWCAAAAGTLFLQRGAGTPTLAELTERLSRGQSAVIFPEGTTGTGEVLGRFHARLFGAATATGLLVQPVALRFSEDGARSRVAPFVGDDDFLSHLLRVLAGGGLRVELVFAAPIRPKGQNDRRRIASLAAAAIESALAALPALASPQLPAGADGRGLAGGLAAESKPAFDG